MSGSSRELSGEKARRSGSFGAVASDFERFRPSPPTAAVEWMLPPEAAVVVDLGAGTGAMTRDLVARVATVIAIEPDDRMRAVLAENVPAADARAGTGESMPLADASVDAVLAASSWHWMDADRALREAARVLRPGGVLGAVWVGPDRDGPFLTQAQSLLTGMSAGDAGSDGDASGSADLGAAVLDDENRIEPVLAIPADAPFAQPEHQTWTWDVPLTADDLIGLLGTFSWIITMPDERRGFVISEARRILRDGLGVSGDVTVDVQYRCEAWRTRLERDLRVGEAEPAQ